MGGRRQRTPAHDGSGKSPDAYRTISEASAQLGVADHVLRFWETRFPEVRPVKRAGGRRYYRPGDLELLARIRDLLYRDGYSIKGVQRLLKTHGARGVVEGAAEEAEPPPAQVSAGAVMVPRRELEAILSDLVSLREQLP